ncbi:DNA polymerase III subunit epsilon [Paucibacter aquatile]|uniref:DNA-directed DNA polymerase n=1 Tax=Kinneretia aquatilis TaxID=2070761 RepID=A0A2N8KZI8_9BURK|nr:3'-5' exonuclease [Paucibacter aquatile]PND38864.1 DNA polymerase III subunit epsilon [Paucibacter aquatile]
MSVFSKGVETVAVIDFETSGLGPGSGGRATEIAAVLVRGGQIVDRFQSLMHTGVWVPPFIEQLTGISNAMLDDAPPAAEVMRELAQFTRGCPLVAHNASFDRGFWQAEMAWAGCEPDPAHEFVCTVLLARRLYADAPNCKLGTLARHFQLPDSGRAHRALADASTTAHLLLRMKQDVAERFAADLGPLAVDHAVLSCLQRSSKTALKRAVQAHAKARLGAQALLLSA